MSLSVWQRHIVDDAGNVQAAASVGVKLADTATNASIYEDQDGLTPLANPFAADVTGFAQFYIDNGEYDIYVGGTKKWSHVQRYRLALLAAAEVGAEAARDKAEEWAEKAENAEVEVGQYSALHHAAKASASATSASGSATAAQGAKTAAEAAQVAAELAEDNAVAVVYSGEASLTPAAGKIPIADANGHIDPTWIGSITTVNPSLDLNFGQQEYRSYVDHLGLTSWPLVGTGTKITFTRAGTGGGTYFDAMGVMQQAGEDEPRIDYDPATGECLGLLVEESRANLLTYSADFSNADWAKVRSSVTSNATVAPDGTTTVDKLVATADQIDCYSEQIFGSGAGSWVGSLFVKWDGTEKGKFCAITAIHSDDTSNTSSALFNLETGELVSTGNRILDADIEELPGGLYRIWAYWTTTVASTSNRIRIRLFEDGTVTGDGTSGLYVWGAQLEAGAFVTSAIPTTTAAITRSADVCSITSTNFSEWYRQGVGTVVCEGNMFGHVFLIDNSAHDSSFIRQRTAGAGIAQILYTRLNSGASELQRIGLFAPTELLPVYRTAVSWSVSEGARGSWNGNPPDSDTSGAINDIPLDVNRMFIGCRLGSSSFINGHVKRLSYYPTFLTNTELIALTRG